MIEFIDTVTDKPATPQDNSEGFFVGADGCVYEYIDQSFANCSAMIKREFLEWKSVPDQRNTKASK